MEFIKKKICLENFKSRIPGMNEVIDEKDMANSTNGTWGDFPKNIVLWNQSLKYHTIMSLYYSVLDIIMHAEYFEYDDSGKKWLVSTIDWRDTLNNVNNISYASALPETGLTDRMIVGLTTEKNVNIFYDTISLIGSSGRNGFDLVDSINKIIGKFIIPYQVKCNTCKHTKIGFDIKKCESCDSTDLTKEQEMFVPYFIYWKDIDKWIDLLNRLKTDNCCEAKLYKDYGGDTFLEYLTNLKENGVDHYPCETEMATIDIPILLTSTNKTIGNFKVNEVDIIDEDGEVDKPNISLTPGINKPTTIGIVKTSGESQFITLRQRKKSTDDYGQVLPFIIEKDESGNIKTKSPFSINYPINPSINGSKGYADMIVEMVESCTSIEVNESQYLTLIEKLKDEQYEKDKGTLTSPVTGITTNQVSPDVIRFGSKDKNTIEEVENFYINDVNGRFTTLRNDLLNSLNENYPNILCFKQDYKFDYELIYGVEDTESIYEDEDGNIITPLKEEKITKSNSGTIYIMFNEPQITVTYVLGASVKVTKNKIQLNEKNIFKLHQASYASWNGTGIWYRETFPMKKVCVDKFLIDNTEMEITYDIIDIDKQQMTYTFAGIDFPREKYILCKEIMYKSDSYKNIATSDVIFRDEKMLGLDFPLQEKYDVTVERGTSGNFEKHLQLTEIKTWQDLENYRNGMFLNK
jgi:hypothetical protein